MGEPLEGSGTAALNKSGDVGISSVTSAAAGSCAAGGFCVGRSVRFQAFVVSKS